MSSVGVSWGRGRLSRASLMTLMPCCMGMLVYSDSTSHVMSLASVGTVVLDIISRKCQVSFR